MIISCRDNAVYNIVSVIKIWVNTLLSFLHCDRPCIAVCSNKSITKAYGQAVNPPDLWIHGAVADVDDKMSDEERDSISQAARSDRIGSFTCFTLHSAANL